MLDNHLAFGIKFIPSIRNGFSVRKLNTSSILYIVTFISCSKSDTIKSRTNSKVIVITVNTLQPKLSYTILTIVKITVVPIETIRRRIISIESAIFSKIVPNGISLGIMLDKSYTCVHICVCTKVILLTVYYNVCTSIITGTVAISLSGRINYPRTFSNTIFVKRIHNTVYSSVSYSKLIIRACITIFSVNVNPTGLKNSVD